MQKSDFHNLIEAYTHLNESFEDPNVYDNINEHLKEILKHYTELHQLVGKLSHGQTKINLEGVVAGLRNVLNRGFDISSIESKREDRRKEEIAFQEKHI